MTAITNLTQHNATPDQMAAGVVECSRQSEVRELLTFAALPTKEEIWDRASKIANIARDEGASHAMIGGAPYLMRPLEECLESNQITPLYAFSVRESVENMGEDGVVRKVNVFKHSGFV